MLVARSAAFSCDRARGHHPAPVLARPAGFHGALLRPCGRPSLLQGRVLPAPGEVADLFGNDGDDYIDGGAGDDTVSGGAGNDIARGGSGNDVVHGDDGIDQAMGDAGIEYKAWLSSHGPTVREAHAQAEEDYLDEPIPMDEPFTVMEEQLMFPGDDSLGASLENIINCQCVQLAAQKTGEDGKFVHYKIFGFPNEMKFAFKKS
ncbi:MAG: hypothetical protein WCS42_03585 [Verrucomicrobiota bacterium]